MKRTYKYRIYASEETIGKAERWLNLCRNLYNCALNERRDAFRMQRKTVTGFDQAKELPEIKRLFPEYGDVGSQVLQETIERLDKAYKAYFRRVKAGEDEPGYPRFKGKERYDSFTLKNTGWELDGRFLYVRNVGRFKMRLSRPIQGTIKTVTIRRTATGKWYACFSCDGVPETRLEPNDEVVGLDVGIKSFLTDSEGKHVENPKYLKHALKELRVRQRALARAKKGSNRRKETRRKLARVHEKVANQRNDFHHKLANEYVQKYGTIVFENLRIENMVRNHCLAREIEDCAWGQFFRIVLYKAEEAGRVVIKANPYNTSRRCSVCGAINHDLKLSDRVWVCAICGAVHERDENAATNHQRVGQTHQALTKGKSLCVA